MAAGGQQHSQRGAPTGLSNSAYSLASRLTHEQHAIVSTDLRKDQAGAYSSQLDLSRLRH
jgi:hypothetical protein